MAHPCGEDELDQELRSLLLVGLEHDQARCPVGDRVEVVHHARHVGRLLRLGVGLRSHATMIREREREV